MTTSLFQWRPLRVFFVLIALVYALGAMAHGFNMAGASGYDWSAAPLKWRVLDVVYLILDVGVAAGLIARKRWAVWLWVLTAMSQIVLYTAFRPWVLDVPPAFAASEGEVLFLKGLVAFHAASLLVFAALFVWRQRKSSE